jgi:hypothetical protein
MRGAACQDAKMPRCQDAKMPKCQNVKMSRCQDAKMQNIHKKKEPEPGDSKNMLAIKSKKRREEQ